MIISTIEKTTAGGSGIQADQLAWRAAADIVRWADIAISSLVLMEGKEDGWHGAMGVASKPGGALTLRWRDWPDLPLLMRRDEMALLHPKPELRTARRILHGQIEDDEVDSIPRKRSIRHAA